MRTTRIIFSIALVALAINSFGNNYNLNEVEMENDLVLENWMISPFEAVSVESDLELEDWMTEAFNSLSPESDLFLECWMKVPFETIPMECQLELECWMSSPFKVSDNQDSELWMATAWK